MQINIDYCFQVFEEDKTRLVCWTRKKNVVVPKLSERGPIPLYHVTRQVTFQEVKRACGTKVGVMIICSCNLYKRVKGPCRHIYCVIGLSPVAEHFGLENFKSYEVDYGENEAYTRKVDEYNREVDLHGGGLLLDTSLADLKSHLKEQVIDLDWYMETLGQVGVDVNPYFKSSVESSISIGDAMMVIGTKKKKKRNNTALDIMANPTQQGAYTRAHASFSEIAELAKTEEEVQIFLDGLANIRGKLMARKAASSGENVAGGDAGLMSFPEVETSSSVARKKPWGSPSNFKRSRK